MWFLVCSSIPSLTIQTVLEFRVSWAVLHYFFQRQKLAAPINIPTPLHTNRRDSGSLRDRACILVA